MASTKRSGKKADEVVVDDPVEERVDPVEDAVVQAQKAAEAESVLRRDLAQRLLDRGLVIENAGQDQDGRHWFSVRSNEPGAEPETVYVEGEK